MIHPGMRERLDKLLTRIEDPLPEQRARLEEVNNELQRIYNDPDASQLRTMPRDAVERTLGEKAALRQDELLAPFKVLEAEAIRLQNEIDTEKARLKADALNEISVLRRRLIDRNNSAREMAEQVRIDETAVKALEAQDRSRDAAVRDITEFYGLTGARGPRPEEIWVQSRKKRAEASPTGKVDIGTEASRLTIFHEMAHHIEFRDPSIARAAKSFVEARARHVGRPGELVELRKLLPGEGYRPKEKALIGDFIHPYTGKVYPGMMTEVVTTGTERLRTPKHMLELYRQDPEHFFFTLGAILL
jgi:hypothetical protein